MVEGAGKNQGLHLLDDFVCEAVLFGAACNTPPKSIGRGINQGVAPMEAALPEKSANEVDRPASDNNPAPDNKS